MVSIVLSAPQIARRDLITYARSYLDGQQRLWSAAAHLQRIAVVEPHAWIEPGGELREGLRISLKEHPDAVFFLFLEGGPCD